jgi:hypothetical protein
MSKSKQVDVTYDMLVRIPHELISPVLGLVTERGIMIKCERSPEPQDLQTPKHRRASGYYRDPDGKKGYDILANMIKEAGGSMTKDAAKKALKKVGYSPTSLSSFLTILKRQKVVKTVNDTISTLKA